MDLSARVGSILLLGAAAGLYDKIQWNFNGHGRFNAFISPNNPLQLDSYNDKSSNNIIIVCTNIIFKP